MNRMKDLFWMAVIVLFAAFSSCSDDKNDGTDEGVEAKLLTFGFYAEDNSSILSDDYIATLSSTTAKGGPALVISVLTLVLNLILTGIFVLWVKNLALRSYTN